MPANAQGRRVTRLADRGAEAAQDAHRPVLLRQFRRDPAVIAEQQHRQQRQHYDDREESHRHADRPGDAESLDQR